MARDETDRILAAMSDGVTRAGKALASRFRQSPRPASRQEIWEALRASDAVSEAILRPALAAAFPAATWEEDEGGEGPLPSGHWWVCDTSEGNINYVHGRPGWCVTATLVRDNETLLTAAYVPLTAERYTAAIGEGAFRDGARLRVSTKSALDAALVSTGQALPGEDDETRRRLERDAGRMLDRALLVRLSVPATIELFDVAEGRLDGFWQPSAVRSGLLCGALLVGEAGGTVTDFAGEPWTLESRNFLAAAPDLHAAMVAALAE